MRVGSGQQSFVFAFERERCVGARPLSFSSTSFLPRSTRSQIWSSTGKKLGIDQYDIVFGVIDRIEDLLGREPHV